MKISFFLIFFYLFTSSLFAEILIFRNCSSDDYEFEKNDYKIFIEKGIMIREFIYTDKTYEKLRINDIRVKKKNITTQEILVENGMIISEISGFPTFYTQLIFDTFDKTIKIKSVLHNSEGIRILSNCEKLIKYKLES